MHVRRDRFFFAAASMQACQKRAQLDESEQKNRENIDRYLKEVKA